MKSKKLASSRLICPDKDPASRAFWPYRHGAVTAFPMALTGPYSTLIYPSSLGVGRCRGDMGMTVTDLCGRKKAITGNTWCEQPPAMRFLKLPGTAPAPRRWPKAARTSPTKPHSVGPQCPRTLRHDAHLQIPPTEAAHRALLFTGHEQQQVIYQMSKHLVSQRNSPPKSILERPTLCPQSQSERASFPQ